MFASPYKLTLDPDGTPFVLLDWGWLIASPDLPSWTQSSDWLKFLEADEAEPRAQGQVEQSWQLTIHRQFANYTALATGLETVLAALPVGATQELSCRVLDQTIGEDEDDDTRTGLEWRWEKCVVAAVAAPQVVPGIAGGLSRALVTALTLHLSGRSVVGA